MARRGSLIAYIRRDDSRGGAPLVPASWDLIEEADRWATIYPLGRVSRPDLFFHVRRMLSHETLPRALYVCVGLPAILQRLADRIAEDALTWTRAWASLNELRSDLTEPAATIKASFPDERPEGDAGSRVRLFARIAGFDDDDGES